VPGTSELLESSVTAAVGRRKDAARRLPPVAFGDPCPDPPLRSLGYAGWDEATVPLVEPSNWDFLRQDTAVFPDSVQTIKLLVAEGDLVAVWTTYEGTQQGPMGPKIAEWWVTWDNMTILRALGHSEWLRRSEPQSD
jgi:hypothetical protein